MKEYKLGEICTFIGGGTPSKSVDSFWDGDISWASVKDLKEKFISETELSISIEGVKNSSTNIANKNDLILCTRISPGRCAITSKEIAINQDLKIVRPVTQNLYINEYLYYQFILLENEIISLSSGSTVKGITLEKIKELQVILPSIDDQKRIVNILDMAQVLINKRKRAIAKLDELVQAVFMDMFGNPVANPMGWEVQKLKSLSTKILSGNTPKGGSQVYVDKGIVFFRSQNIWKNRIELDDVAYIDEQTHWKMSQTSVKNRDILITKTGRINTENSSLGRAALFLGEDDSANINGHVYLVRLKKGFIHEFVLYILITDEYRDYIREVCVGGIDKRQVNKEHLEEFPIIMPPIDLQQRFADYVRQVDKSKSKMQQGLKHLESNFQALLQKAFKGELKVKDGVAV